MEGDFEDELRLAMAEHVRETNAPHGLAEEAVHRFRRRVRRRRMVGGAAIAAVAVAVFPVYGALAPGGGAAGPRMNAADSSTPVPGPHPRSAVPPPILPRPSSRPSRPGEKPGRSTPANPSNPANPATPVSPGQVVALGYLPAGLRSTGPCSADQSGARLTTSCQWRGAGGAVIDVRVIRDSAVRVVTDLGLSLLMPRSAPLDGTNGLVGNLVGGGGEAVWMDRSGVAVDLSVSPPLSGRLIQIADGVQIP